MTLVDRYCEAWRDYRAEWNREQEIANKIALIMLSGAKLNAEWERERAEHQSKATAAIEEMRRLGAQLEKMPPGGGMA